MSLINQMLKDLEHRSRPAINPVSSTAGLQVSSLINLSNSKNIAVLLVLSFILLTAILFLSAKIGFFHKAERSSHLKTQTSPAFIKEQNFQNSMPVSGVDDLHISAAAVTGLTLQVQKEKTLLRVLLTQDSLYTVSRNAKQQYVIILNHAQLVSNLPAINTLNTAIQDIRMMNNSDGDLHILLTLKNGAVLDHLELNNEGKFPELQIDINYKDDVYSEASQSSSSSPAVSQVEPEGRLTKSLVTMRPEEEYQTALQYSVQGDTNKAVSILTTLISRFPDYALARESLVKLLLEQGKQLQANNIIQIGLQQHPFYAPYAELKARILVDEGKIDDAISLLQKAAPSVNNNPQYHAFIAALYQKQGKSTLAAQLYEQLLPLEPDNSVWWMGLGIAYEDLGKHNEAIQAYARANNSDKLSPELRAYVETRMHSLQ